MTPIRPIALLTASVAWGLASAPAWAVATAQSSLGPLVIELFDLNLSDDVSPAFRYSDTSGFTFHPVYASASNSAPAESDSRVGTSAGPYAAVQVSASTSLAQATAGIIPGGASGEGAMLWASGATIPFVGASSARADVRAQAVSGWEVGASLPFVLSAHTAIVLSAVADQAAYASANEYDYPSYSRSYASLQVQGPGHYGASSQSDYDTLATGGYVTPIAGRKPSGGIRLNSCPSRS